jgi:tRNA-uridine 2-sulfurtransferase
LAYNQGMDRIFPPDSYIPDKNARAEKVMVAISGSLDSLIATYLLKIQKYELTAVTLVPGWGGELPEPAKLMSCQLGEAQLTAIKAFCDLLNIPHTVVNYKNQFEDEVVEAWMGSKLAGSKVTACWSCHDLKLRLLHAKMKELGASKMATGHFAKIFRHDLHGTVFVHSANDEQLDQSQLLSRLPHEILHDLILPMSDLKQRELTKLATNFGLQSLKHSIPMHHCFPEEEALKQYIRNHAAASLLGTGEMISGPPEYNRLGEHEGIINYRLGAPVKLGDSARSTPLGYFGEYLHNIKRMVLHEEKWFQRTSVLLTQCRAAEDTSWIEPLKAVLQLSNGKLVDCWIFPKNFSSFLLEWEEAAPVYAGEILTVFKKKGPNAKVLFTGKVQYHPELAPLDENDENVKVDHSRDF